MCKELKVGLQAIEMVASVVHGAASLKEVATLPLPKEPRTRLPRVTGGIPAGYELTADPMDVGDSADV